MVQHIAIIGGGIGGLCTAIALRRHGIEARVYEVAPELKAAGAGIWVPINAMQVLQRMGIADEVTARGKRLTYGEVKVLNGPVLSRLDLEALAKQFGHTTVSIHRARLQDILVRALPSGTLVLGSACAGVEERENDVLLRFKNGTEVAADAVIGADGLHSVVRSAVAPHARLRYAGQTSYRGVCRFTIPHEMRGHGGELWGTEGRIGFSPIGRDEVYWFAVEDAPAGGTDAPGTLLKKMERLAVRFPDPIPAILSATREEDIIRTDLYDLKPLDRWWKGRVVLVGDAAHATTPNLGQGGAQAIEDAWALASCIATHGVGPQAFQAYQNLRMRKARQIVTTSWWLGKAAHVKNPIARALRNALMRAIPESASRKQLEQISTLNF